MKIQSCGSLFGRAGISLIVLGQAVLLSSCVKFSGDPGPSPVTTTADQRWPGGGDYSYRLDDAVNGTDVCSTGDHAYTRLADYCLGLEDRDANQACALPRRREAYAIACGTDFAETDLPAMARFSGYDSNLQRNCTMASAGVLFFAHQSEDCAYLANESLHHGCGWEARRAEFAAIQCSGSFSPQPSPSTAEPTPTPTPTPWPSPTPSSTPAPVDTRPQIVKDLASAGISSVVNTTADHAASFWPQLASVRDLLLARRNSISQIAVSDSLSYDSTQKILQVGYQFTADDLRQYLSLLDRRAVVESRLGIAFSLGVDAAAPSPDHVLHPINEEIVALEKQQDGLLALHSVLHSISVDDGVHFQLSNGNLRVSQAQFASDLTAAVPSLQQVMSFSVFAKSQGLTLEDSQVESTLTLPQLAANLHALDRDEVRKSIADLVPLVNFRFLTLTGPGAVYLNSDEIDVPTDATPPGSVADLLREMDSQFTKAAALKVQVLNASSPYDATYLAAMSKFDARYSVIKAKKTKFDEIDLGADASSFQDGVLRIGAAGTLADLDQILAKIH